MAKTAKVRVTWEDWKKNNLPMSGKYSTLAKFPENFSMSPNEFWSVNLVFLDSVEIAMANFLSADGPHDWLKLGCQFEMWEGSRPSAKVEVLEVAD